MRVIENIFKHIASYVENGDSASVKEHVRNALIKNTSPEEILKKGLMPGMEVVGKKFKNNEVFIPEVLIATRAMKAGMDIIKPYLSEESIKPKGKVLMGTVKGDLHDIGKKIVSMVLGREGYEVIDLGIDVPKESFLKTIRKENPAVVGISALLTTTMAYMREVIETLEHSGMRKKIKVIIGGAPITQTFADEIKADGYAPDAESAVSLVEQLLAHAPHENNADQ
jgi:5-methyltetrahydrofolate--homocysteine methyltransferase